MTKRYKYLNLKLPRRVQSLVDIGHPPKCNNCGALYKLTFDHIIPKSKGGKDSLTNGRILCRECNQKKGSN